MILTKRRRKYWKDSWRIKLPISWQTRRLRPKAQSQAHNRKNSQRKTKPEPRWKVKMPVASKMRWTHETATVRRPAASANSWPKALPSQMNRVKGLKQELSSLPPDWVSETTRPTPTTLEADNFSAITTNSLPSTRNEISSKVHR